MEPDRVTAAPDVDAVFEQFDEDTPEDVIALQSRDTPGTDTPAELEGFTPEMPERTAGPAENTEVAGPSPEALFESDE